MLVNAQLQHKLSDIISEHVKITFVRMFYLIFHVVQKLVDGFDAVVDSH